MRKENYITMMNKKEKKDFSIYKRFVTFVPIIVTVILLILTSIYVGYFKIMQNDYNRNMALEQLENDMLEKEIENLRLQIVNSINMRQDPYEVPVNTYIYSPTLEVYNINDAMPDIYPLRRSVNNYISQLFGIRKSPVSGRLSFHHGLDLVTDWQGWIIATASGIISESGWDNEYGNYIVIDHQNGYFTLYAHLDDRYYWTGQRIEKGIIIGRMGNTGYTDGGAHLHYEIFKKKVVDDMVVREYVDPLTGNEDFDGILGYLSLEYILDVNNRIMDSIEVVE